MPASPPGPSAPARLDDGAFVEINGLPQWIAVRGRRADNPALMLITGPGVAFSPLAPLYAAWEDDFTLVHWDQPNAGATFAGGGWVEPYGFARLAADGLAVAEHVRARLGVPLALFCVSGGTPVGLMMARARPELICAYVGNGQVVNRAVQEALSYEMILAEARAAGDAAAVAALTAIGPPPYAELAAEIVKSTWANAMTPAEQAVMDALGPAAFAPPPPDAAYVPHGLPAFDVRAHSAKAYAALKPELDAFDARALGLGFDVPMVFLQGAQDRHTVSSEVEAYAAELVAPSVAYVPLPGFGHMSSLMAERLRPELVRRVRPLCTPDAGKA